ncbi:hypothetical protein, partial [Agrobacterium cavarae]
RLGAEGQVQGLCRQGHGRPEGWRGVRSRHRYGRNLLSGRQGLLRR